MNDNGGNLVRKKAVDVHNRTGWRADPPSNNATLFNQFCQQGACWLAGSSSTPKNKFTAKYSLKKKKVLKFTFD